MSGDGAVGARAHWGGSTPNGEWGEAEFWMRNYFCRFPLNEDDLDTDYIRTVMLVTIANQLERIADILEARLKPE